MSSTSEGAAIAPLDPTAGEARTLGSLMRWLGKHLWAAILFMLAFGKTIFLFVSKSSLLTMIISIGAYAIFYGWGFAIGLVLLLFAHEMGHVWQARREGLEASAPMFIPFLGALIIAKGINEDPAKEARVGIAGPVVGSLATLVPLVAWLETGSGLMRALAYFGFFLNLFNLLPILPLDGGRVMSALSPWLWIFGYAGLGAMLIFMFNPILLLILLFGAMETLVRINQLTAGRRYKRELAEWEVRVAAIEREHADYARERRALHGDEYADSHPLLPAPQPRKPPAPDSTPKVPKRTRLTLAVLYVALAAALVLGIELTFMPTPL